MRKFDCDYDVEKGSEQVSRLTVQSNGIDKRIAISVMDNYKDLQSIEVVSLDPSKARELAAELIRLVDEIEGVLRHSKELYDNPINLEQ